MTSLVTTKTNLNSKKGRQIALQNKIAEIDNRLNELGVSDLKYKIGSAISNPETNQNTINIFNCPDISLLFRLLAYFKNIIKYQKEFCKDAKLEIDLIKNIQGFLIQDIIKDIELRIVVVSNSIEIDKLTKIKNELLPFIDEENRFISALKNVDKLLKS